MSQEQQAQEFAAQEVEKLTNGYTDQNGNFISGFQYWCSTYVQIAGHTQQQINENMQRDHSKEFIQDITHLHQVITK